MKALVYEGPREMNVREVDVPTVEPDEVLIRVAYSGICGSELSGYLGQNALRKPPLIFGLAVSYRSGHGCRTDRVVHSTGPKGTRRKQNYRRGPKQGSSRNGGSARRDHHLAGGGQYRRGGSSHNGRKRGRYRRRCRRGWCNPEPVRPKRNLRRKGDLRRAA